MAPRTVRRLARTPSLSVAQVRFKARATSYVGLPGAQNLPDLSACDPCNPAHDIDPSSQQNFCLTAKTLLTSYPSPTP